MGRGGGVVYGRGGGGIKSRTRVIEGEIPAAPPTPPRAVRPVPPTKPRLGIAPRAATAEMEVPDGRGSTGHGGTGNGPVFRTAVLKCETTSQSAGSSRICPARVSSRRGPGYVTRSTAGRDRDTWDMAKRYDFLSFSSSALGGGELGFELADFVGVVHLFFGAGQARLQLADFLAEDLDAFLGFFVHGAVSCHCQWSVVIVAGATSAGRRTASILGLCG